ncbi:cardiotrophin-2 [Pelobates cultripes]|uniref:Cardiotrophin-2 n=1 Tax=Pelobates cultripes TaxID=61616 RepID=A0AAD1WJ67_PELCU|nr:cardiotrophin-2 [Pelobates cultripes]
MLTATGVTLCCGQELSPAPETEIITQIRSQTVYLQGNATSLLNTFLKYQEKPFSCPGFSFPSWQEPGLPTASMGFKKWRCLCSGERLLLARNAFSSISEFFQLIQDDQLSLNPQATDLHQLLEAARWSSEAVLNNLVTAFEMLGFQPPPLQPDTLSWTSAGATSFQKKVRGYVLCREYRDWLSRVAKDMDILNGTRRGRQTFNQERRDCCRSSNVS